MRCRVQALPSWFAAVLEGTIEVGGDRSDSVERSGSAVCVRGRKVPGHVPCTQAASRGEEAFAPMTPSARVASCASMSRTATLCALPVKTGAVCSERRDHSRELASATAGLLSVWLSRKMHVEADRGEPCASLSSESEPEICAVGLMGEGGTCRKRARLGEPCLTVAGCFSGRCEANVCVSSSGGDCTRTGGTLSCRSESACLSRSRRARRPRGCSRRRRG